MFSLMHAFCMKPSSYTPWSPLARMVCLDRSHDLTTSSNPEIHAVDRVCLCRASPLKRFRTGYVQQWYFHPPSKSSHVPAAVVTVSDCALRYRWQKTNAFCVRFAVLPLSTSLFLLQNCSVYCSRTRTRCLGVLCTCPKVLSEGSNLEILRPLFQYLLCRTHPSLCESVMLLHVVRKIMTRSRFLPFCTKAA